MEIVTVWKRKRPAGWGSWRAYSLETDSYGTWVFTPAHSTFIGDDGTGNVSTCEVAQDTERRGRHSVVLLPTTGWFVAHWVLNADHVVSVDITTPPVRSGSHWSFEDLELDPFVLQDGTFDVEDEDEFAAACEAGLITNQERDAARHAVDVLREELTAEASPLIKTGRRYLTDAAHRNLDPLVAATDAP